MAYLDVRSEAHGDYIYYLDPPSCVVGRDPSCGMTLPDQRISRTHFRFFTQEGGWYLEDLGSTNGVLVNGASVNRTRVVADDEIEVGPFTLYFREESTVKEPSVVMRGEELTEAMSSYNRDIPPSLMAENDDRFNILLDIAAALDLFGSTTALLQRFTDLTVELFAPSTVEIRFDREKTTFESTGEPMSGQAAELADKIIARALRSREALVYEEMSDQATGGRDQPCIDSILCAPIFGLEQQVRGGIYLDRRDKAAARYSANDLRLLVAASRLMSAALLSSLRFSRLLAENKMMSSRQQDPLGRLLGESTSTRMLTRIIEEKVGPTNATVLLTGETGTGKAHVAERIHLASRRAEGPFISVNCAAIPKELIESELFGHEQGAFSGSSSRRKGFIEAAEKGTIFLDEIGELASDAQSRLVNVLQDGKLMRVGSAQPLAIDVRIIAATTNRDLRSDVVNGHFRADLFYRLNVVHLIVSPLRERKEDILPLANHFLSKCCHEMGKNLLGIHPDTERLLLGYSWPGNVRELSNCIERAVIFADDDRSLLPEDLPPEVGAYSRSQEANASALDADELAEKEAILEALRETRGNRRQAAKLLGWYPQKFYARLKRYGIG